ncbi:Hpt domain-containing protein [Carboxylicivirga caseinilyticus]|uniref:Hpt domain-containing protein n=1 Tax=Carboxylicivirga caseinilyticus TaxID=3417572 RepID=UPI002AA7E726|nr:Hpt domain-containing protein [uncultured Carboxylicivirga sp.]MCU4164926.1 Hpt domain-containing protein [Marinilabiliaceae bacterium A049]
MPENYKHIDLAYLESITDGSKEIIAELITIFIEQIPEFTQDFEDGLSQKDWKKVASAAHKAKSSVLSMGINELGNVDLKNLELVAKQMLLDRILEEGETSSEADQLRKTLESYPEDKREWIAANKNEEVLKQLIDKFNYIVEEAVKELNQVLEN